MSHIDPQTFDKRDKLAFLRSEILRLEGFKAGQNANAIPFGVDDMDASFPLPGLPMAATHEFCAFDQETLAATFAFIAALLSKSPNTGAVVWIERTRTLYPPGLAAFGLDAGKLIFVEVRRESEALAVIEEALRTEGLLAVVGQIEKADLDQTRRLQLAVEHSGTLGLLVRVLKQPAEFSSACVSRWRVRHAPSEDADGLPGLGQTRWQVALDKVRHGQPKEWLLDWLDGAFQLVTPKNTAQPLPQAQPARVVQLRG